MRRLIGTWHGGRVWVLPDGRIESELPGGSTLVSEPVDWNFRADFAAWLRRRGVNLAH